MPENIKGKIVQTEKTEKEKNPYSSSDWMFKEIHRWKREFPLFSPEEERLRLEEYCGLRGDLIESENAIELIEIEGDPERLEGDYTLVEQRNIWEEMREQMKPIEDEFIHRNVGLVLKFYKRYSYFLPHEHKEPILQEGFMGILKALEKFDLNKKVKFSTYASWWILQKMRSYIRNSCRTIRIPMNMHDTLNRVGKILQEEGVLWDCELLNSGIQQILIRNGYTKIMIKSILAAMRVKNIASLDFGHATAEEILRYDRLVISDIPNEYDSLDEKLDSLKVKKKVLKECLKGNVRNFGVILLLSGLHDTSMTLDAVGKIFNMTRERIRQIRNQVKGGVRKNFEHFDIEDISDKELSKYMTDYCELPYFLWDILPKEEYHLICYRFGIAFCDTPQVDSEIAESVGINVKDIPFKLEKIMGELDGHFINHPLSGEEVAISKYLTGLFNPTIVFESEFQTVLRRMFYKSQNVLTVLKDTYGITVFKKRDHKTLSQEVHSKTLQDLKEMFKDIYILRGDQKVRFVDYLDQWERKQEQNEIFEVEQVYEILQKMTSRSKKPEKLLRYVCMKYGILTPVVSDFRSIEKELGINMKEGTQLNSEFFSKLRKCPYKILTPNGTLSLKEFLKKRREIPDVIHSENLNDTIKEFFSEKRANVIIFYFGLAGETAIEWPGDIPEDLDITWSGMNRIIWAFEKRIRNVKVIESSSSEVGSLIDYLNKIRNKQIC